MEAHLVPDAEHLPIQSDKKVAMLLVKLCLKENYSDDDSTVCL